MQISDLKVIEDAMFRADLIYKKNGLYYWLSQRFNENNHEYDKILNQIIQESDDHFAHNVILHKDLKEIKNNAENEFDESFWNSRLEEIGDKIKSHIGVDFTVKPVNFCDSFPQEFENFEKRGASSIKVFKGKKGIYYLKKRVDNTSTAIHIIHEQIHNCLSQNKDSDQIFVEWFEEGLAILYSMLIYYEITRDRKTLEAYRERSSIFSKLKPDWDFTKRYFEHMKIMSSIFLAGGFALVKKLIGSYLSNNRKLLNSYLDKFQSNNLAITYKPKDDIESFLAMFSNIVEPEGVTPLEYVIVESLTEPKTISEISKEIHAPENITKKALGGLFGRGICIRKDDKIDILWRKKDLFDHGLIKPVFPLK